MSFTKKIAIAAICALQMLALVSCGNDSRGLAGLLYDGALPANISTWDHGSVTHFSISVDEARAHSKILEAALDRRPDISLADLHLHLLEGTNGENTIYGTSDWRTQVALQMEPNQMLSVTVFDTR